MNLNPDVTLGVGGPAGSLLNVDAASANTTGDVGVVENFNGINTNPPTVLTLGTKRIIRFKFHIKRGAALGASPVTFTNTVVTRLTFDAAGQPITTPPSYMAGKSDKSALNNLFFFTFIFCSYSGALKKLPCWSGGVFSTSYRKSGVMLLGLQPKVGESRRLFNEGRYVKDRYLMTSIDELNQKHGRQTLRFGMPIKREKSWQINRHYLSRSYTTNPNDILRITD